MHVNVMYTHNKECSRNQCAEENHGQENVMNAFVVHSRIRNVRKNITYTHKGSVRGIRARDKITDVLTVLSLTEPRPYSVASIDLV